MVALVMSGMTARGGGGVHGPRVEPPSHHPILLALLPAEFGRGQPTSSGFASIAVLEQHKRIQKRYHRTAFREGSADRNAAVGDATATTNATQANHPDWMAQVVTMMATAPPKMRDFFAEFTRTR